MEWNGGGVRTRRGNQLAILEVRQCALHRASREASGGGDRLMRHADRPVRLLGRLTIEVEVNDERGQAPVVTHEVGQKAVEHVGVEGYLYHSLL